MSKSNHALYICDLICLPVSSVGQRETRSCSEYTTLYFYVVLLCRKSGDYDGFVSFFTHHFGLCAWYWCNHDSVLQVHIYSWWIANTECLLFPGTTRNQWVTRRSRTPGTSGEYLSDSILFYPWFNALWATEKIQHSLQLIVLLKSTCVLPQISDLIKLEQEDKSGEEKHFSMQTGPPLGHILFILSWCVT